MALSLSIVDPTSGESVSAYLRIESLSYNRKLKILNLGLNAYRSKEAADSGKSPIRDVAVTVSERTQPTFTQVMAAHPETFDGAKSVLYGFLKTLKDFSGASDAQ